MSVKLLKLSWRVCGIAGVALLAWSFLKIQTDEVKFLDCLWEILLAVVLLAAAFQSYRKWDAAQIRNRNAAGRNGDGGRGQP